MTPAALRACSETAPLAGVDEALDEAPTAFGLTAGEEGELAAEDEAAEEEDDDDATEEEDAVVVVDVAVVVVAVVAAALVVAAEPLPLGPL